MTWCFVNLFSCLSTRNQYFYLWHSADNGEPGRRGRRKTHGKFAKGKKLMDFATSATHCADYAGKSKELMASHRIFSRRFPGRHYHRHFFWCFGLVFKGKTEFLKKERGGVVFGYLKNFVIVSAECIRRIIIINCLIKGIKGQRIT